MTMLTEQVASRVIASLDATCPCFPDTCRGDAVNGRLANGQRCKATTPVSIAPVKRWPFVESPGGFTERLRIAIGIYDFDLLAAVRNVLIENPPTLEPINMILHCPNCGVQHIDAPDRQDPNERDFGMTTVESQVWTNPPHRSHLCHKCGHVWRPADVPTNGVAEIQTKGKEDSPRPLIAVDRVPRGMKADDAEKLIREAILSAGIPLESVTPLGWNMGHRIVALAHNAGFREALKRVGLGVKD